MFGTNCPLGDLHGGSGLARVVRGNRDGGDDAGDKEYDGQSRFQRVYCTEDGRRKRLREKSEKSEEAE